MELIDIVMDCIVENEIGGNLEFAYRFSDPDGLNTGKSGYSFGRVQFDIENNWLGILCLKECQFRPKDLDRLFEQRGPIDDLDAKLRGHQETVDRFDALHVEESVTHCQRLIAESGIQLSGDETLVHIVDYHNQFYMSRQGKIHRWLQTFPGAITPEMILDFKLNHTAWGKKRPDDVRRRFNSVAGIMEVVA